MMRRALMHDETVYPEPMKFFPERFQGKDHRSEATENINPRKFAFGFGRRYDIGDSSQHLLWLVLIECFNRVCPAIDLGESSVFILVATTLATFTISKAKDSSGVEIVPEEEYTPGTLW